jgi:hypothetical protein
MTLSSEVTIILSSLGSLVCIVAVLRILVDEQRRRQAPPRPR